MIKRPIGYEKILKDCASYDLALDLINALGSISTFREGYYMYYYTNIDNKNVIRHEVKYQEFKNGYKFTVDNKVGFIINESNYKASFVKLIETIPILVMLAFLRHDLYGYMLPLDTYSFLAQVMDYSSTYNSYQNELTITHDEKSQTFYAKFESKDNIENLSFQVKNDGTANFTSKSKQYPGSIFISDNYPLSSVLMLEQVKEYLRRNYFLTDDLYKLAPLK